MTPRRANRGTLSISLKAAEVRNSLTTKLSWALTSSGRFLSSYNESVSARRDEEERVEDDNQADF